MDFWREPGLYPGSTSDARSVPAWTYWRSILAAHLRISPPTAIAIRVIPTTNMQLHLKLSVAATFLVATSMAADPLGAYDIVAVGPKETQLLTKALADDALYQPTIKTRACFVQIDSIGSQVVSGTKYKFKVKACTTTTGKSGAGKCAGENTKCKAEPMVVMVFDQPWTETLQVMSIEKEAGGTAVDTAKSGGGAGSSAGSKATPVVVVANGSSSGSSSDGMIYVPSKKPEAKTTPKPPAPSTAVPSPSPKSGAASVACATTALALAVAAIAHVM